MNMGRLFGGASPYAHLAGLVPVLGRRAEDDKKDDDKGAKGSKVDDDPDEDDPPKSKTSKADDEQPDKKDDDDNKGAKGSKVDDEDDPDQYPEDGDDPPKSKKSKTEDDEDDDKDEMSGKSAASSARLRERARCKAIIGHPAAARNIVLAASLAFDTSMTRREAIKVMDGQAARGPVADLRGDRTRRNADLGPGGEASPSGKAAVAASWDRALAAAGVKSRK